MKKTVKILLMIFVSVLLMAGCAQKADTTEASHVDYSKEASWLALPEDPNKHEVDVFFLYPTIFQGDGVQDITDPEQIEASEVPVRTQASVFGDSANIYAPLYRQVGREGFGDTENLDGFTQIAKQDAQEALLYYLENYNNGKPFIIAGHSQGSSLLADILNDIWGTTGAENRMIATYIIGYSVTESDMKNNPNIRMCEGPTDTGCFISYNSLQDGKQDESIQILDGAVATNPLSWISSADDGAYVPSSENLGAVFFNDEGYEPVLYEHFTSAQVKDHGLVCEPADTSVLSSYDVEGIYHPDDYSLFYENIKQNIADRIDAYFAGQ